MSDFMRFYDVRDSASPFTSLRRRVSGMNRPIVEGAMGKRPQPKMDSCLI